MKSAIVVVLAVAIALLLWLLCLYSNSSPRATPPQGAQSDSRLSQATDTARVDSNPAGPPDPPIPLNRPQDDGGAITPAPSSSERSLGSSA
jgi:hypothetical protein